MSNNRAEETSSETTRWHHRPAHLFLPNVSYIITASTLHKHLLFRNDARLAYLQDCIFTFADQHGWCLEAWSVFGNHYHLIAVSPDLDNPDKAKNSLKRFIQQLHSETARGLNRMDATPGRQVWFQYRDTCLTFEKSYLARLNYVHNNPVKHGLVLSADQYPYCSARWFKANADPSFCAKVASFGWQRVMIDDDFTL